MMKAIHDIDALISKFLAGEATPDEAMLLEDWKMESHENETYFQQSEAIFGHSDSPVLVDAVWEKLQPQLIEKTPIRKLNTRMYYRVAAAISVLLVIGLLVVYLLPQQLDSQVLSAENEVKKVKLDDGTEVAIAAHSSIELAEGYGTKNRSLQLKGSGYFSVKHSDQLPFIINAGPIHIKDLGTKFNVDVTDDTIFVRVDEGIVEIYDNKGMKITLKANESAHYVISTGELELEIETGTTAVTKTFVFDNQRLEAVLKRINEVYQVDIHVDNPTVNNCLITTQFSNETIDIVVAVIAETLGLTVEKSDEKTYLLKGESCVN